MDHPARQRRFSPFVAFLRSELDRVGPAEAATSRSFFTRAVVLEKTFLDAAFNGTDRDPALLPP
jgi:hypothetical protein